ncbi:MAG: transposase [Deltaproteobacteria bacterium]|nr:transposase [Deltaproteobacteria bacterium]
MEEVRGWQTRPLDPVYPVVISDALRIKIRDKGMVKNKAVYLALDINVEGIKEIRALEGAQGGGHRPQSHLSGRDRRSITGAPGRLYGECPRGAGR